MERLSFEDEHGWRTHTQIEPFKRRAGLGCGYKLWVISTIMLFKNIYSTKELKGIKPFKFKTILFVLLFGT